MVSKARKTAAQASYQQGQRRNFIINGDMALCQRATSSSSLGAASGYFVQDRWRISTDNMEGRFTMSQDAEAPDGFANSMKIDCTTAETSTPDVNEYLIVQQRFEGLNLQSLNQGDAQAKAVTVSFWVRSPKTGVHTVTLYKKDDADGNNRLISSTYTIASADTWEYHTCTFPGDTTGAIPDDNSEGLALWFWLLAGSDRTSGTFATSWESYTAANACSSSQVNILDSTDNNFYLTGVQMELGNTVTEFQYESHAENLARCQRYYEDFPLGSYTATGNSYATNAFVGCQFPFRVTKRATPTLGHPTIGQSSGNVSLTSATGSWVTTQPNDLLSASSVAQGQIYITASQSAAGLTDDSIMAIYQSGTGSLTFDSEL
jgi:hypothetical protein